MDKNKLAVAVFDKCADIYVDKYMDVTRYDDTYALFCNSIPRGNAAILELACGPGNITRYLLQKRPGYNILGTDLSPNMLRLAAQSNPAAEFQLMDCRTIGSIGRQFDGAMCGFCLPYLSKEEAIKLIGDASGILAADGVLYISTMEDDYSKSGIQHSSTGDELYMYYHQADYLTDALTQSGFHIISLQRIPFPANDGTQVTDLVIIARKAS